MPLPQLRAHVKDLDRKVEEERARNPYVAAVEETLQGTLDADYLAEVRLRAAPPTAEDARHTPMLQHACKLAGLDCTDVACTCG